ncbi:MULTISPECIES: type II toxin-antitoxin system HicA family toxin [Dethiosulfovibrio]|uniref:YcfA family protein n=3 Tax=Dethiosulfovibrio TaxID=47054 RepID=D2Z5N1_9BACT|nr:MULTISPECIES: type II toxin-antitoxin system HicA family toxin [Dethiosulfovibrio]EFC90778.1 YcfA family protein [Dethiosulfovibrio peptidovorans DSM 11002]MCF4115167.1 type II toxin-antitoxin system HicA family toxin [Dethiosulfovibrio russensis]MCF4143611.1 type II toxin-antitoxin system HicA family toxin [Dethiosulfovibrio marinus]MCF4146028.1 type II toxin-antitoxin system HicA family toxin [Dethiosulfovibrio acidaminovorans]
MGKFYSQRDLIKIARQRGWQIDETRGKGSHVLAMKPGERPFPIPRKIKPGLLSKIKKRLDIED